MIGFMFPNAIEPPSFLVRAVIAITLFEAAYIAEIVQGGLQAVPRGQVEAAQAIGLSPIGVMRLVVPAPGAARVIPAMVGQFISCSRTRRCSPSLASSETIEVSDAVTKQDAPRPGPALSRWRSWGSSTGRAARRCRAKASASNGGWEVGER